MRKEGAIGKKKMWMSLKTH